LLIVIHGIFIIFHQGGVPVYPDSLNKSQINIIKSLNFIHFPIFGGIENSLLFCISLTSLLKSEESAKKARIVFWGIMEKIYISGRLIKALEKKRESGSRCDDFAFLITALLWEKD
jgi:hypothetical protein